MAQTLILASQMEQLKANAAHARKTGDDYTVRPVVKLFTPDGSATWLISEIDSDGDTMFGLCDLGHGFPELGSVSLRELKSVRGKLGLPVERDIHFKPRQSLGDYAAEAKTLGYIKS